MWDNRQSKRNPKAPDFKCRDKSCDGVIWPPKNGASANTGPANPFNEPEYLADQERHEKQTIAAIKQGDTDGDKLLLYEQRMNICMAAAARVAAKNDGVVSDPQAIGISFFIELNRSR